jgi:hypothetical protein
MSVKKNIKTQMRINYISSRHRCTGQCDPLISHSQHLGRHLRYTLRLDYLDLHMDFKKELVSSLVLLP